MWFKLQSNIRSVKVDVSFHSLVICRHHSQLGAMDVWKQLDTGYRCAVQWICTVMFLMLATPAVTTPPIDYRLQWCQFRLKESFTKYGPKFQKINSHNWYFQLEVFCQQFYRLLFIMKVYGKNTAVTQVATKTNWQELIKFLLYIHPGPLRDG